MVKEPMYEEEGGRESNSSPHGACTGGFVCGECVCMLPASGISHAAKMNGAGFICNVNAQTTEEINVRGSPQTRHRRHAGQWVRAKHWEHKMHSVYDFARQTYNKNDYKTERQESINA